MTFAPDGRHAVVTNLNGNSLSILDTSDPANPVLVTSVIVGVQPTQVIIDPARPYLAYVTNLGSPFVSVVDIRKDKTTALLGVVETGTAMSGIAENSTGNRLYVAEFKTAANVRVYDPGNMPLDPVPPIDIPGEPRLSTYLTSTGNCSSSFYITEAKLADGQKEGEWGMEVLVSQGQLSGGFNLGGGLEANGGNPSGFGAFSLASPQHVTVSIAAQALDGSGSLGLTAALLLNGATVAQASGKAPLNFGADLQPGFYVVSVTTGAGAPRGTFQMGLAANAFSGGVVVGGFITQGVSGFGAFCVPQSQNVSMRLVGASEYGTAAAGDLILNLYDSQRNLLRSVANGALISAPVTPPSAPAVTTSSISLYVDAAAPNDNGTGTAASPFRSITKAISVAKSGNTIFVRAGRYSISKTGEKLPIGVNPAWPNGVNLIGAGAATTIIDGENFSAANVLQIGASNIRVAGFTVRGSAQAGLYAVGGTNVQIDSNLFTSNTRFGLGGQGVQGLVVTNNVSVSNLETGIAFAGALPGNVSNLPKNCAAQQPNASYGAYIVNNISNDNRADGILVSAGGSFCVADNSTSGNGSSGIEFNNRTEGSPNADLGGAVLNNQLVGNGGQQFAFAGTGLLVTEGAHVAIISGNKLEADRPFGIGIFLNGVADLISGNTVADSEQQGILVQRGSQAAEISGNTVTASGLSGLFVENGATVNRILNNESSDGQNGLSVLNGASVGTVTGNRFERNSNVGVDVELNANVTLLQGNFIENNEGGVYVARNSSIATFNNQVRNNRSLGGVTVGSAGSSVNLTGGESSLNGGVGVGVSDSARVTLANFAVNNNSGSAGFVAGTGGTATLNNCTLNGNLNAGISVSGGGTSVQLTGGNTISNTVAGKAGAYSIIVNAPASIFCAGSNGFLNNPSGIFGSAPGCQ